MLLRTITPLLSELLGRRAQVVDGDAVAAGDVLRLMRVLSALAADFAVQELIDAAAEVERELSPRALDQLLMTGFRHAAVVGDPGAPVWVVCSDDARRAVLERVAEDFAQAVVTFPGEAAAMLALQDGLRSPSLVIVDSALEDGDPLDLVAAVCADRTLVGTRVLLSSIEGRCGTGTPIALGAVATLPDPLVRTRELEVVLSGLFGQSEASNLALLLDASTGLETRDAFVAGLTRAVEEYALFRSVGWAAVAARVVNLAEAEAAGGKAEAEQLVRVAADRLRDRVGEGALIARLSRDTLGVLLIGVTEEQVVDAIDGAGMVLAGPWGQAPRVEPRMIFGGVSGGLVAPDRALSVLLDPMLQSGAKLATLTPIGEERVGTVLVADDDPVTARFVSVVLTRAGFTPVVRADGESAVALLADPRRGPLALVVLDLELPGLHGFGVLDHLRADGSMRTLPVLVLTARDDARHHVRALRDGAADFLTKPVSSDILLARVQRLLASTRATPQPD